MEGSVFSVFGDREIWKWEKKKKKKTRAGAFSTPGTIRAARFGFGMKSGQFSTLPLGCETAKTSRTHTHTSRHAKPRSRESQNHLTHSLTIP